MNYTSNKTILCLDVNNEIGVGKNAARDRAGNNEDNDTNDNNNNDEVSDNCDRVTHCRTYSHDNKPPEPPPDY